MSSGTYLLGGALGAAYVFSALVLVSQIGAGAVAAATVTGQLTTSVILDRIGFLGLEQTSAQRQPGGGGRPAAGGHLPGRSLTSDYAAA